MSGSEIGDEQITSGNTDTAGLPAPRSLWVETAPAPDRRGRALPTEVEVAVLGAGIAGLTTAFLLARAGRSVLVLEAGEVAGGVSGHTSAKLSAQHGLKYHSLTERKGAAAAALYARTQSAAIDWVERTATELEIACGFSRRDSFVHTGSREQLDQLRKEVDAACAAGLPASFADDIGLAVPSVGAVRFTGQAQFHPRRWLLGLAEEVERAGGMIVEGVRAQGVDERGVQQVRTTHGTVRARDVVVATHYPILDRGLFFARLEPTRDLVVSGPVKSEKDRISGMYLDSATKHSVRGYESETGPMAIVLGEHYRTGERIDVEARYRALAAWAREHAAVRTVTHRWSAHDMSTVDSVPYVGGYHPTAKHLWVATGFGQWGMSGGTAAGHLLCDLILGNENASAALYDPNRMDARGAVELAKANGKVGKHFVGDHLRAAVDRTDLDDLPAGTATVTTSGVRPVAAYRDDEGTLHKVGANCTHLGCVVAFNNAEKTWDCPCHASRFGVDGSVIHGPATRPLPRL
ncbi:Glycine/D-amino acid oxidase [Amycolatopsis marina]|uniref:Glycine/D-amino acid oxidase n=1 Tax=Amycolatopsis marina TaxID=490629 RepID=A0A1I0WZH1_9PSEU|nr:FAD-dependent oxidoreductase [Amycolatopsis marina]SFA94172.1 Glycine/D-amino acid oxidase [Amycolatopsis marina]